MEKNRWTSFDLIFFDCDSTLSKIEGIDELARLKGKNQRVGLLTDKAMNGELDLAEVYGKRLRAIRPTRGQLKAIEERYWETQVEDAKDIIAALHFIGKKVFIISGGLTEAVKGFGRRLGVDSNRIRAVDLEYNELSGEWWKYHEPQTKHTQSYLDYDEGPLTISSGKPAIIEELARGHPGRRLMVGDGSSDLATKACVDLFAGFGGVIARETVRRHSDVYITSASLAPMLPLAAGMAGYNIVENTEYQALFKKGVHLIRKQKVVFADREQRDSLIRAFEGLESS